MIKRLNPRQVKVNEKLVSAALSNVEVMQYLDSMYLTSRNISLTDFVSKYQHRKDKIQSLISKEY